MRHVDAVIYRLVVVYMHGAGYALKDKTSFALEAVGPAW
jgi:hypothetical protein